MTDNASGSYFYISLISNKLIVKEQLRIFDTNSIIGTIGGALGLFVGFSCLTCIKDIFDLYPKSFFQSQLPLTQKMTGPECKIKSVRALETFEVDMVGRNRSKSVPSNT